MYCQKCGEQNSDENIFCSSCGRRLEFSNPIIDSSKKWQCPICGNRNDTSLNACSKCGNTDKTLKYDDEVKPNIGNDQLNNQNNTSNLNNSNITGSNRSASTDNSTLFKSIILIPLGIWLVTQYVGGKMSWIGTIPAGISFTILFNHKGNKIPLWVCFLIGGIIGNIIST